MTQIWIKDKREAGDLPKLLAKAMAQRLPQPVCSEIMRQRFTVVPNTSDDRGGYLVVFQVAPKQWWQFWR